MLPTQPTTAAERRVLRWLLLVAGVVATGWLLWSWWQSASSCQRQCVAAGSAGGTLKFKGGNRLESKTVCECVPSKPG